MIQTFTYEGPAGYTAVRFGIPHQGEQYLTPDYLVFIADYKLKSHKYIYALVRLILEKQ